jgi:hypothetical protein
LIKKFGDAINFKEKINATLKSIYLRNFTAFIKKFSEIEYIKEIGSTPIKTEYTGYKNTISFG